MGIFSIPGLVCLTSRTSRQPNHGQDGTESENPIARKSQKARLAPLVAGLGCPLSLLLEIPVLTEHLSTTRNLAYDSPTLSAGLIISLILMLIANVSLICRYFEYRPQLSTLAAIGHLTLHDILNVAILAFFGVVKLRSSQSFPQTGWMMIASSAFSSLCNITLVIDYIRVDNFRAKGSGLTTKQRTLVIVTMSMLLYIGFGAMVFTLMDHETMKFSDAIYFCVCTVTTVGFGDVTPTSPAARIFTFFYAIVGICTLALLVTITRETIFEVFESLYSSGSQRISERMHERRMSRAPTKEKTYSGQLEDSRLENGGHHLLPSSPKPASFATGWSSVWSLPKEGAPMGNERQSIDEKSSTDSGTPIGAYKGFRKKILEEERQEFQAKMVVAGFFFACFWLLGGVVFKFTEGWTYGEALYFGYAAFLTIGYGDYAVRTPGGRAFFIAWSLVGIGNMTFLLTVLTQAWEMRYKRAIVKTCDRRLIPKKDQPKHILIADNESTTGSHFDTCVHGRASGADVVHEAELEKLAEIPELLVQAAKEFSRHASFWMHGGIGNPPAGLVEMMKEAQKPELVEHIKDPNHLIQNVISPQIRQKLLLISFARTFDILVERASEATVLMKRKAEDLKRLEQLNGFSQCGVECNKACEAVLESGIGSKTLRNPGTSRDHVLAFQPAGINSAYIPEASLTCRSPGKSIRPARPGSSQDKRLDKGIMRHSELAGHLQSKPQDALNLHPKKQRPLSIERPPKSLGSASVTENSFYAKASHQNLQIRPSSKECCDRKQRESSRHSPTGELNHAIHCENHIDRGSGEFLSKNREGEPVPRKPGTLKSFEKPREKEPSSIVRSFSNGR